MRLVLTRTHWKEDAVCGSVTLAGAVTAFATLERATREIPCGTYAVRLSPSQRSIEGHLWAPHDHRLPELLNVPGRSGIRIHAANAAHELEGCIAVGMRMNDGRLEESRNALIVLVSMLESAEGVREATTLEIRD